MAKSEPKVLESHRSLVLSASFSPDGKTLASASFDRTIKLWNVADGKEIATFEGHRDRGNDVQIGPDGKTFVSASEDATVRIWNLELEAGDNLMKLSCQWLSNYIANHPEAKELAKICDRV